MVVVHYIMGIPPLRGGGLIKYAIDLAEAQNKFGYKAFILYAGEIKPQKSTYIHKRKTVNRVEYYEIVNPLPVSVSTGMCDEKLFMKSVDEKIYESFFVEKQVDVLHIHSLMGMHREMIDAAKKIGIKTLFTTHDYFGICPKANLLCGDKICTHPMGKECNKCCPKPYSYKTLVRKQSHWFEWCLKCKQLNSINDRLTSKKKTIFNKNNIEDINSTDYNELAQYYKSIFEKIDLFHYNSSVAKEQYEGYLGRKNCIILGVMHQGIEDKRKIRKCNEKLHFGFFGGTEIHKGYELLVNVVKELRKTYPERFVCDIYTKKNIKRQGIVNHGVYTYNEIDNIFETIDVLIVPSIWAETYGFVVLEAFAHGRPVIVTNNVGAKDLLVKFPNSGLIINATEEQLMKALKYLIEKPQKINQMNEYICNVKINIDYNKYISKVEQIYATIKNDCYSMDEEF